MLGSWLTNFMRLRRRPFAQDQEAAPILTPQHAGRGAATGAGAGRDCEIVEVRGIFVGMAARHALGYRFVAADPSVLDMNESIWPTLDDLRRAVAQRRRTFRWTGNLALPARRSRRSGAVPYMDGGPGLIDQVKTHA